MQNSADAERPGPETVTGQGRHGHQMVTAPDARQGHANPIPFAFIGVPSRFSLHRYGSDSIGGCSESAGLSDARQDPLDRRSF
jgi:hypothetical protein